MRVCMCVGGGGYSAESGLAELRLQHVNELHHEKATQRDEIGAHRSSSMTTLLMDVYGDTKQRGWDALQATLKSTQKALDKDLKKLTADKAELSTALTEQQQAERTLQASLQDALKGSGSGTTVEILTQTLKEYDTLQLAVSALESQQRVKQGEIDALHASISSHQRSLDRAEESEEQVEEGRRRREQLRTRMAHSNEHCLMIKEELRMREQVGDPPPLDICRLTDIYPLITHASIPTHVFLCTQMIPYPGNRCYEQPPTTLVSPQQPRTPPLPP